MMKGYLSSQDSRGGIWKLDLSFLSLVSFEHGREWFPCAGYFFITKLTVIATAVYCLHFDIEGLNYAIQMRKNPKHYNAQLKKNQQKTQLAQKA